MNTFNLQEYLISRHITKDFGITMDGNRIAIPVHDVEGNFLFNKYRKHPDDTSDAPKYTYEKGTTAQLFNAHRLDPKNESVYIYEGEFDCLLAASQGYNAVSSTGGAATFKEEWAQWLVKQGYKEFNFYFDNDEAGLTAMSRHAWKLREILPTITINTIARRSSEGKKVKDVSDAEGCKSVTVIQSVLKWEGSYKKYLDDVIYHIAQHNHIGLPDMGMEKLRELCYAEYQQSKKPKTTQGYDGPDLISAMKQVPIEEYLTGWNHELKMNCIWHNEKTPSMRLYKENNKVYCFGCQKSGDVIDVVAQLQCNGDTSEALKFMKSKHK